MVASPRALFIALLCALSCTFCTALFDHSNVLKLDNANFSEKVADGKVHFIKFFAPWCGHCKKLAPTWSELADSYKGSDQVTIAQVDCTTAQDVCKTAEVTGYPTLKAFYSGTEHAVYRGPRTLDALKEFVDGAVTEVSTETTQ